MQRFIDFTISKVSLNVFKAVAVDRLSGKELAVTFGGTEDEAEESAWKIIEANNP